MPPKALLLDFDGLVCDTERASHRAWKELYAEHALEFPDSVWQAMVGHAEGELLAAADLAGRISTIDVQALATRRRRRKRDLCDTEPLRPGVRALLDTAARRSVPAAVVSSSPRDWVVPHLDRLGVRAQFSVVVTGDMTARHKPHPDLYELALARLGLGPRSVVAFEDSAVGVRAARAAGILCVAVANAVVDPADLSHADFVLPSLSDYDIAAQADRAQPATAEVSVTEGTTG